MKIAIVVMSILTALNVILTAASYYSNYYGPFKTAMARDRNFIRAVKSIVERCTVDGEHKHKRDGGELVVDNFDGSISC